MTILLMSGEKLGLLLYRVPNGQVLFDLKLTAALHTKVTKLEWVVYTLQSLISVSALVHQIDLSDDTDCTFTFGVYLPGQLKRVRSSNIDVSRSQSKDQGVLGQHEPQDHLSDLILNVGRLAFDRHLCKSWQVDQSQIDYKLRVDHKRNRAVHDAFEVSSKLYCLSLYLLSHEFEVGENLALSMGKLCILISWMVDLIALAVNIFNVFQVENQRAPSHNA